MFVEEIPKIKTAHIIHNRVFGVTNIKMMKNALLNGQQAGTLFSHSFYIGINQNLNNNK
jgi:hypothetical protein